MATSLRPLRLLALERPPYLLSYKRMKHTSTDNQPLQYLSTCSPLHPLHTEQQSTSPSVTARKDQTKVMHTTPSLSILPISNILRSIVILSVSSSSWLLRPSLAVMDKLAHPSSSFLDPDRNPILRRLIKNTVYAQFCAGENRGEVQNTVKQLRKLGYKGVVLAFAKENDVDKNAAKCVAEDMVETPEAVEEITAWSDGNLETVRLASQGDFVAIKFTGAGNFALKVLAHNLPPTPSLRKAIDSICDLAAARNVRLLFDAEHQAVQAAIDAWTLESMKKYNGRGKGATVYGTYQAYLKATPRILAEHLAAAREAGFVLGVKLVRGAYLGSDPRNLINDTKEETDRQYDGIAASLMQCSFNNVLQCNSKASDSSEYPDVNVVLASHNELSVRLAQKIRTAQAEQCQPRINLVYAQLMGMADEVSCELLKASRVCNAEKALDVPLAYKYLVWGTTGECMKYLLRRAHENRDAVGRTRVGRDLMIQELWRRIKGTVGLA